MRSIIRLKDGTYDEPGGINISFDQAWCDKHLLDFACQQFAIGNVVFAHKLLDVGGIEPPESWRHAS